MSSDGPLKTLQLTSPLGTNTIPFEGGKLIATRLKAVERISAPFELEIEAVSWDEVDPEALLHRPVTLRVTYADQTDRLFNGLVRRVVSLRKTKHQLSYGLHVVPRLWFLGQTIDCRIFQQQTADDILRTIFVENDINPVEFNIFGNRPIRPYTTQFNETDLDFVQRLMQESGYFYYFRHSETQHTLVITDSNQSLQHQPDPNHSIVLKGNNRDVFDDWREIHETAYGRVTLQDRDPENPRRPVSGKERAFRPSPGWQRRDVYRWPAMTIDNQVAADRARFRLESSEASASLIQAHGFDPLLCAGFCFTLEDRLVDGAVVGSKDYVVHEVTHEIVDDIGHTGGETALPECMFTCFPLSIQWRDALSVPRPTMAGIFSGIVLGNEGEETHTDNLARIKVQPLFDHRKDSTADRSIFIRILHAWSGDRWGWQHLPRVGTEVGLAFMNGDPDNPVMAGCFYHEDNMPVFPVPDHQTRQGFRDGKPAKAGDGYERLAWGDFNELSFEHRKGKEEVFLNAQRDLNISVVNDTEIVQRDGYVLIKSPVKITLDVGDGASRIVMTPENISITSPTINVLAEGAMSVEAGLTNLTFEATNIDTAGLEIDTGAVEWNSLDFTLVATCINTTGVFLADPEPIPLPD